MIIFNVASLRQSERDLFPAGAADVFDHQPAEATKLPSGQPGLELRTATKLSSAGFEPTAVPRHLVYESVVLTTWLRASSYSYTFILVSYTLLGGCLRNVKTWVRVQIAMF